MEKYKPCSHCIQWRHSRDNLSFALNCITCKGTGIVRDTDSYVCNKCGKNPCYPADDDMKYIGPCGLIDAHVSGGYNSPVLSDCVSYEFTFCEACLRTIFDSCVVPPTIGNYVGNEFESYAEEHGWYEERLWRKSGGPEKNFELNICNANKDCKNPAIWREFQSACLTGTTIVCEEHKKDCTWSNSVWAKISDLPTDGNKKLIVKAYLKALEERNEYSYQPAVKPGMVVYFQFAPHCMKDLIGIPQEDEDTSCLWVPDELNDTPIYVGEILILINSMVKNSFISHGTLMGTIHYVPREAFIKALKEKDQSIIWR